MAFFAFPVRLLLKLFTIMYFYLNAKQFVNTQSYLRKQAMIYVSFSFDTWCIWISVYRHNYIICIFISRHYSNENTRVIVYVATSDDARLLKVTNESASDKASRRKHINPTFTKWPPWQFCQVQGTLPCKGRKLYINAKINLIGRKLYINATINLIGRHQCYN